MHDSRFVRLQKAIAQPVLQDDRVLDAERSGLQPLRQRHAIDKLHREIGAAELLVDREHVVTNDGVVIEAVQDVRFLAEQFEDQLVGCKFRQDDLDRHLVTDFDGMARVDLAHAARRDELVDFVDSVEAGAGRNARCARNRTAVAEAHVAPAADENVPPSSGSETSRTWVTTTVTLSPAPRSSVISTSRSHASCGEYADTISHISSSET